MTSFSISEVATRTGVPEGTLRMWERRHGFPAPERSSTGRRSYGDGDLEQIRRVAAERASGVTLAMAIERARSDSAMAPSVHATLRRRHPDLSITRLAKPLLLTLSRAVEDECLSRGERLLVFGAFQSVSFYRQSESRWRELARNAEIAVVLADFARVLTPRGGPVEVPFAHAHPLSREWVVVCDGNSFSACVVGWESPAGQPAGGRTFESLWSTEPEIVRVAARVCARVAADRAPELAELALARLAGRPVPSLQDQLTFANAITNRMLTYLSEEIAPSYLGSAGP